MDTVGNVLCLYVDETHAVEIVVHEELQDVRNVGLERLQDTSTDGCILKEVSCFLREEGIVELDLQELVLFGMKSVEGTEIGGDMAQ